MLVDDFEQILLCGEVYEDQLSECQSLPFTNREGKITCVLIIELRTLLKSKSYYITIFHSSV